MIVLQASHIEKHFDGTPVLSDATLIVQSHDRVALVGSNGAGKSTLIRILIGELEKDAGEVSLGKNLTIGYISQFVDADETMTAYDYVANVFSSVYALERKLRFLENQMSLPSVYSNPTELAAISDEYAKLQHQFEESGGYGVGARIRRVLDGLGFTSELQNLKVSSLSGGQKTRLSLAKLLALQPNLLVLDEPTNYLDTDTLTWLENYLQDYDGALLVVSHDRYFLDQLATHIVELDQGRTTIFVGNYSDYVEEKADRMESAEKRYEAQQKEIAKLEEFVQKNIVRASTTKRAQSRRKMLAKMELLDKPFGDTPQLSVHFQAARPSGKDTLTVHDVCIGYEQKTLAKHISMRVSRGNRIAIIGPNGTGKTTLFRTLLGELPPISGTIHWGQYVELGYYDQEQSTLLFHKTVLDQVWDEHRNLDNTTIRGVLARFLFGPQDIQKPISALSGGERSRLNLCRLMLTRANTLLLDEPTNHLDLMSKEMLEDALSEYDGTLLFISHDRYFIDAIATHVAVLTEDGIQMYIGNYSDYREKKANDEKWAETETEKSKLPSVANQNQTANAERTRVRSSDIRKARERVEQIEQRSQANEERQAQIVIELNEAVILQDVETTKSLQSELVRLESEQSSLLEEWSDATDYFEELAKHDS